VKLLTQNFPLPLVVLWQTGAKAGNRIGTLNRDAVCSFTLGKSSPLLLTYFSVYSYSSHSNWIQKMLQFSNTKICVITCTIILQYIVKENAHCQRTVQSGNSSCS
jgi:hypothetical protein